MMKGATVHTLDTHAALTLQRAQTDPYNDMYIHANAIRPFPQASEERTEVAEGRSRELYEANKRLESHVHDLESRKRAPLYQKKQEVGVQVK